MMIDYSIFATTSYTFTQDEVSDLLQPTTAPVQMDTEEEEDTDQVGGDDVEMDDPFLKGLKQQATRVTTEKGAPAFNTSGDPRLDFFFHIMEQTPQETTVDLLEKSWQSNDLQTLKLIAHLHDIKKGKGIRRQFQQALYWMYKYHPKTLYHNLSELASFGYWKDLLHLVIIICFHGYIPDYMIFDDAVSIDYKSKKPAKKRVLVRHSGFAYNKRLLKLENLDLKIHETDRKQMRSLRLKFARKRFLEDKKYRAFHLRVAQLFAEQLVIDLKNMKTNEADSSKVKSLAVSLAGKWAPSLEQHFDRYTLISTTVAMELARSQNIQEVFEKPVSIGSFLARRAFHKDFCVPLRQYLKTPEVLMSARSWSSIEYNRVPSKCMQKNKRSFIEHDKERLEEYLESAKKLAGATLKPVELIERVMKILSKNMYKGHSSDDEDQSDKDDDELEKEPKKQKNGTEDNKAMKEKKDSEERLEKEIIEKQWTSLVESIATKKDGGLLKNAIAICDVSGSMHGTPMFAAIGLTLVTMAITDEPWNSMCITFSENPQIQQLKPNLTLFEKVNILKDMEWGGCTNFQRALDLVLNVAVKNKLTEAQLPKLLLVFTDMEFDCAFSNPTSTNFEAAKKAFKDAGYSGPPPILFWNLRESKSTFPVQKNEFGCLLMSGYSGQQLGYLMNYKSFDSLTPLSLMTDVIDSDRYKILKIYD